MTPSDPRRTGPARSRIDFDELAQALLNQAEQWVSRWLPGGRRNGHEWQAARTAHGGPGDSLSVNLRTGRWGHFSHDGAAGGDLVSLYAYLEHQGDQGAAARDLQAQLGIAPRQGFQASEPPPRLLTAAASSPQQPVASGSTPSSAPGPSPAARTASAADKPATAWRAVVPVPPWAPKPTFQHYSRQPEDIERIDEYRLGDELHGYVVRFRTSDGGKDPIPHTWCVDDAAGNGSQRWHWKTWDEPRPLFVPSRGWNPAREVLVVEGEKCATVAHEHLGDVFDVVSWPGGGKAWGRAAWHWLAGRRVVLWPDCDGQREQLTKAERAAGVDPATKPLLPEHKQPGRVAMERIAECLSTQHGCTVRVCTIPAAGSVKDGWDIADAVDEGWDAVRLQAFVGAAKPWSAQPAPVDQPHAGAGAGRAPDAGGAAEAVAHWGDWLLMGRYGPLAIRENVVMALDGVPERGIPGIDAVTGLIAFNEFSNNVVKTRATPWGTPAGTWWEEDELLMGDWLCRHHGLPSMPRGTLEEAVRMVAFRHRFHPVRRWLNDLRGQWDGVPRLATWLRRACLEEDEWDDESPLHRYLAKVGTWTLMAMCARVLTPGCKFDYMLILEGSQGLGKSTLVHALGGEYAADTPLNLGDKDSFQNLQGIWVYEMGELDALSRSEITRTKQFISSVTDRFRATFDRRPKDYPRQCVFVGTTNEAHYLTDPTGNRRFWPVQVTRHIDQAWLKDNRRQLLAEALHRLDAGERYYPTPEESRDLFEPQQQQRQVDNAIESAIVRYLHDESQGMVPHREKGTMVQEISLVELLSRIGISIEKLGPGRFHEKQAAAALRKLGWKEGRSSAPGRPRVFRRPAQPTASATSHYAGSPTETADEACPF